MIAINNCPSCNSGNLETLKTYIFNPPANLNKDNLEGEIGFSEERLWIFFKKIRKQNNPAQIKVNLCNNCGLIFTNPRYTEDDIKNKYNTIANLESAKLRTALNPALNHEKRAKRIYKLLSKYFIKFNQSKSKGFNSNTQVIDVGGAEGYNLIPFVLRGADCFLVDYVKKENYFKGITYLGKDINELGTEDKFDIILFCHTLEHVTNPAEVVARLSLHLKENGLLYIEVPLGSWQEWQRLKEPLTHVNFFSEESLYKLVSQAGLDVIHLSTDYQWITHNKLWCVNLVAQKSWNKTITGYKTSRSQMKYLKYAFLMFLNEPQLLFRSIKYRLLGRKKQGIIKNVES